MSRGAFGVDDVTGQLRAGALLAPLPVAAFDLDDVSVRFIDGQCSRAEGNVRLTLAGEVAGIGLPSGLTGAASCADGAVAIPRACADEVVEKAAKREADEASICRRIEAGETTMQIHDFH